MRPFVSLLLTGLLFLTGCASHGIIVQKESRPHPFYESVGVEGMYTFVLRDETGAMHRQMVTPEVYERYAIGDNFNDEQLAPATNDIAEPKTVQIAMHRPTFAVGRIAGATKTVKATRVASTKSSTSAKLRTAQRSAHPSKASHVAAHHPQKKTAHTRLASHSRKHAKVAISRTKKLKTVAAASKTPKPWKLTAPTVEPATASQPAPPAEGPSAATKKPALRETQVDIPDSP